MQRLGAYLPQDRLRALANGQELPNRTNGSAIFADISGFTLLTEKLTQTLGPRQGVEELSRRLNAVYSALIDRVESYGGSVISFAGDSIIGWFEAVSAGPSAPWRAVSCAQAMQSAMHEFNELSLRISITTGSAQRFVVGDQQIQSLDALAGRTISRLATGERLANRDEIILDLATCQSLGDIVQITAERIDEESAEKFYIAGPVTGQAEQQPIARVSEEKLSAERLRPWLLPMVYLRECSGMDTFLTELRPAVPMFASFSGIDYDIDEHAEEKLNAFVAHSQHVIAKYDGALLQLVIGDKGSYIYAVFGAPTAHEDAAQRAIYAALELKQSKEKLDFIQAIQIGASQGMLRVGVYGSLTRRTYAALGDDVNLAARLMTTSLPGEILISGRVQFEVAEIFTLEPREPIRMKGKGEPQAVFAVTGISHRRATRLPEPAYRLPMIGRQDELALVDTKLNLASQGQGQVIGIIAEAGLGKSRLIAEVIRLARKHGFVGYGGACQSSGMNTPYLVWQSIWQAFFDFDLEMPQRKQIRWLEGEIEDRAPGRVEALPLLGLVLDLPLADNDFTRALEPKDRKIALEALLEDCLKSAARETPLLIVLEDLHWIDPLSNELLETLARISETLPVCFVLAYRPPDVVRYQTPRMEGFSYFTKIELKNLTAADAEQLIRAKLAQLFPERTGALPKSLTHELIARSQGNPFFIEELLNYLHDRGLNPYDAKSIESIELPASLQTLILSRVDQLTESQKVTLKVASVIGRFFPYTWLHGYYPSLGDDNTIKDNLSELSKLDLTPLDTPEPELAYLFKHVITQEVAYQSLSSATRAQLHELLAHYLEQTYPTDPPIEALAYHYSRSDNLGKKWEYLRKSGEAAQAAYSNATALEYYRQVLEASPEQEEAIDLHINSGIIYQLIGKRTEAKTHYQQALQIATANHLTRKIIECEIKLGNTWILQAEYPQAIEWLEKAQAHAVQIDDRMGLCDALCELGIIHWRLAKFDDATRFLQQGIDLARQLGAKKKEAYALSVIGQLKAQIGKFAEAHQIFEEALVLAREINDKRRTAGILNNYATTHYYEGNYAKAQKLLEEGLAAVREIGDKRGAALALNNLGNIFYLRNDFNTARKFYEESLALGRETDDKYIRSLALTSLGITVFRQGKLIEANLLYQESLGLSREIGDKVGLSLIHCYFGLLALAQNQTSVARGSFMEGLMIAHQSDIKSYIIYNLIGMANLLIVEGKSSDSVILLASAIGIAESIGLKVEPELQEPYEKALQQCHEKLSEAVFQSTWDQGRNMNVDQAVRFASER